jgi:hypothetical protein
MPGLNSRWPTESWKYWIPNGRLGTLVPSLSGNDPRLYQFVVNKLAVTADVCVVAGGHDDRLFAIQ